MSGTHLGSEPLVALFLDAYWEGRGRKAAPGVQKKLEGVRARGRKRTMEAFG